MKFTFRTFQYGIAGAVGVIFRDGVRVEETRVLQSPRGKADDRSLAASACRDRIFDLRILADYKAGRIDAAGNRIVRGVA